MTERVNLNGRWEVISLEQWDKEIEEWDERQRETKLNIAIWGLRAQGFIFGAIMASAAWYFIS